MVRHAIFMRVSCSLNSLAIADRQLHGERPQLVLRAQRVLLCC